MLVAYIVALPVAFRQKDSRVTGHFAAVQPIPVIAVLSHGWASSYRPPQNDPFSCNNCRLFLWRDIFLLACVMFHIFHTQKYFLGQVAGPWDSFLYRGFLFSVLWTSYLSLGLMLASPAFCASFSISIRSCCLTSRTAASNVRSPFSCSLLDTFVSSKPSTNRSRTISSASL